ncbi:MAG: hypothetical protein K2G75_04665 [Muribaculaceae bacterium]|nr:hypothetical protein [Muribaculaceae bacterium]MDE5924596.1 hypothetical protein [Muribaculaceae bacterium]
MENTDLFAKARQDLYDDMQQRKIGAIFWDNSTAGFHYVPEVNLAADDAEMPDSVRIMGLYCYNGVLYLIEEDKARIDFEDFYDADSEVRPSVVTLTPTVARKDLGDPTEEPGFTTAGSLEEWLTVADCYFEALNEAEEEQLHN